MSIQLAQDTVIAGRFRLNRLLGRGGMGSVWHATHLGLDIPCAVKFIEGEYAALPEAQQRFEREAKAAAALRSPHVVQILDHGVSEGTPYIAMELLDGEDLGKRLIKVGRLGTQELNTVITQVCRALTKAHSANIVHRDLKPDNIFLVRDDDREIAKVLDFGIAKANANALEGGNTKTGAMLGTPYYMSPEQAQGTKSVDYRSDLWSLAVIVFQCVTGRLPFESEALGDLLVKIIVNPIPVPSQIASDIPASFDRWWVRAASRDPVQRFQTAKEFSDSLGLVWGLSQMTDVMDRNAIRAQLAGGIPQGTTPMMTPPGYAGNPGMGGMANTPHPGMQGGMANTPQPGGMGVSPGQMGLTPQPGQLGAQVTTGAPVAHTYNGTEAMPTGLPKKGGGMIIALAVVGVLVLGGAGVGIAFALKSKGGAPPAAAAQTSATTKASSAPTAPPTTTATSDTPATTSTAAAPTASAVPTAVAVTQPTTTPKGPGAAAVPTPKASATAKPPTTAPAGKPRDLGF